MNIVHYEPISQDGEHTPDPKRVTCKKCRRIIKGWERLDKQGPVVSGEISVN